MILIKVKVKSELRITRVYAFLYQRFSTTILNVIKIKIRLTL